MYERVVGEPGDGHRLESTAARSLDMPRKERLARGEGSGYDHDEAHSVGRSLR